MSRSIAHIESLEPRRLLSGTIPLLEQSTASPQPTALTAASAIPRPTKVTTAPLGTTNLTLSWKPPASASYSKIKKYRVTYIPGAWAPGDAGAAHTVYFNRLAKRVTLSGLLPFTPYTISVTALYQNGTKGVTQINNGWTAAPATQKRYLYVVDLPKNRQGFTNLAPQIEVFDINDNHKWVRNIPLPAGIYNPRGVAASAATGRLYISFFNTAADNYQPGGLLCIDLATDQVLWKRNYDASVIPSPDRFDITPDGGTIYMPVGEHGPDNFWRIIDARTGDPLGRIDHVTAPHNTIVSLDGRLAFLEGQEKGAQPPEWNRTVAVVDTATNQVIKRVGPFQDVVRPFTVNGRGSLIYATVNNFVGFQIADVATGKVIYTAAPDGYVQPSPPPGRVLSHGIALTPDERQVWVVDGLKVGIHVWDTSQVPYGPPKYLGFVKTRGTGRDLAGQLDPSAWNDTDGVPAWLSVSHDGRYIYPESGEIIDVATRTVIGQLRAGPTAPYSHSRFIIEVDFDQGHPVRATKQFGIGLVR